MVKVEEDCLSDADHVQQTKLEDGGEEEYGESDADNFVAMAAKAPKRRVPSPCLSSSSLSFIQEIPTKRQKQYSSMDEVNFEARLLRILQQAHLLQASEPSPPQLDDVEHFLLSLAPALRRLQPRHQTQVRVQFLNTLQELEDLQDSARQQQPQSNQSP